MRKKQTLFSILFTLITLTVTSQPAMSYDSRHNQNGTAARGDRGQVIGLNTEAVILGASIGALISSQLGYYPTRQYAPPPRPHLYSRPQLRVPAPFFDHRPVVYRPQPRHYQNKRKHWKRHSGRGRW